VAQADFVELLGKTCRKPVKLVRIPREYLLRAGGHPMGPKTYFGVYLDMPPITEVIAKAQRVLKFKPTDFATGLAETYKWYLRHNDAASQNYSFENALLKRAPVIAAGK
jgi:nucleoside-diphosphate-sugar epimerase